MTPSSRIGIRWNPATPLRALARLVLSLATGTPRRSVENVLPHPGDQPGPYLGV